MNINIERVYNDVASWIAVTLLGIVGYLVRTVLTNGKKLELLEADLTGRRREREEDRERMHKMESAIERVEGILLGDGRKK